MDTLNRAIAKAVERMPASQAALAREAGIPASTVARILSGELRSTPDVARKIMAALRRWADTCGESANEIADALINREGQ